MGEFGGVSHAERDFVMRVDDHRAKKIGEVGCYVGRWTGKVRVRARGKPENGFKM